MLLRVAIAKYSDFIFFLWSIHMQANIKNWLVIFFSVGLTLLGKPQNFKVSAQ